MSQVQRARMEIVPSFLQCHHCVLRHVFMVELCSIGHCIWVMFGVACRTRVPAAIALATLRPVGPDAVVTLSEGGTMCTPEPLTPQERRLQVLLRILALLFGLAVLGYLLPALIGP